MKWAEVLAVFNFITWLLPIALKFYLNEKSKKIAQEILDKEEAEFRKELEGKLKKW